MAKSAEIAVVSHALVGTLDEKVRAGDQIAIAMAQLQINGWDTVQKCKAGFWLADGSGEHPAVFFQNHYVMVIKGRLTVEPKWEYMVRKLKETVPGFTFKVLEETDTAAEVEMSDGVDTHRVRYTLDDAKRQGLMSGMNAWTTGSTREQCFKQVVKRGARRIGVGRAAPWVDVDASEFLAEPEGRESSAEVVVDAAAVAAMADAINRTAEIIEGRQEKPVDAIAAKSVISLLSDALIAKYGKQKREVMLQKATIEYNEMVKANTGTNPGALFAKVEDIGPVDAEFMIEFLQAPKAAAPAVEVAPAVEEAPPPAEAPPPPVVVAAEPEDDGNEYEHFVLAVKRARKLFGRKFLVEAPINSKKYWFIDQATFAQAGDAASIKVMEADGQVIVGRDKLKQLTSIMSVDCDAAERNGR